VNWEAIGALAELLAAVGVIVSLVYLASQIRHSREQMRQNTRAVEAQVSWAHFDSVYKIYNARAEHPELVTILRKMRSWDQEQIKAIREEGGEEWIRALYLVGTEFTQWNARFLTQTSPEERAILATHIAANGNWPMYLDYAENIPDGFWRSEFREFVLRTLREAARSAATDFPWASRPRPPEASE
jgi:hypothetical protein